MQSQHLSTKLTSQFCQSLIRQQYKLLQRQKSSTKIIQLIQQYELNSECQLLNKQLIHYLIIGYILNCKYKDLKQLIKRYQLNKSYNGLQQMTQYANNEQLNSYCQIINNQQIQIIYHIQQKAKQYTQLSNLTYLIHKAQLSFVLRTLSKYYMNISIMEFNKIMANHNNYQKQVENLTYQVKDGFIQLKQIQEQLNSQKIQSDLLTKMKQLVYIAQHIQNHQ